MKIKTLFKTLKLGFDTQLYVNGYVASEYDEDIQELEIKYAIVQDNGVLSIKTK